METFYEQNKIIPSYNFGFRRQHSMFHALTIFENYVVDALNDDKYTACVSLDV